jgi:hypothetical protein
MWMHCLAKATDSQLQDAMRSAPASVETPDGSIHPDLRMPAPSCPEHPDGEPKTPAMQDRSFFKIELNCTAILKRYFLTLASTGPIS